MITSKYIAIITIALLGLSLLTCGFIIHAANNLDAASLPDYQKRLFGEEVVAIDIQVGLDDWQGLLDNAQAKEWILADLIIDGERFSAIGLRTKGNSSLSQGSRSNEGSYSLQFKADKYIKGQTFYGLDAFCVNNMMGDATYMKDYLTYQIMNYIGVATPLANYASVTVNGEDYGFCLMLERYERSFLERVYNSAAGQLYNVKIQMGQRGNFEDMWQDVSDEMPRRQQGERNFAFRQPGGDNSELPDLPPQGMDLENRQFGADMDFRGGQPGGGRGFGGQSGGGSLVYTDDSISSYSAIFNNAVFNSADKEKQRVITAIKNLSAGADLGKYFDVDAILRYFAAHTAVVNLDSYTSNMQQNYYIYERDGKITVLPWDYGLAFGGFQTGSASSVVNFPIDTPVSGVSMEERPLLNKLLEVEEYREKYHDYLRQIAEGFFESGLFADKIYNLDDKIGPYIEKDAAASYTYEQYKAALPALTELGRLRAESIIGQLEGRIPSTSSGQNADSSALIDASNINLNALGSMMGGGAMGQGNRFNRQGDFFNGQGEQQPEAQGDSDGGFGMPGGLDRELMGQAMEIISQAEGELTEEAKSALVALGLTEDQINMFVNMSNRWPGGDTEQGRFFGRGGQSNLPGDNNGEEGNIAVGNANSPPGMNGWQWGGVNGAAPQTGSGAGNVLVISVLLIILIGATVIIAKPGKNEL